MAGRLIYLMGPSGSGKDTVLQGLARLMGEGAWVAPRLITRPATDTERGAACVSQAEFLRLERSGVLAMSWRANGLAYGVPSEINSRLAAGCDVLVNGSREYLPEARRRYGELLPVLLNVSEDILYQRLVARGREDSTQIHRRLLRNANLAETVEGGQVMMLDNSGPVEDAIQSLYRYLLNTTTVTQGTHDATDAVRYG